MRLASHRYIAGSTSKVSSVDNLVGYKIPFINCPRVATGAPDDDAFPGAGVAPRDGAGVAAPRCEVRAPAGETLSIVVTESNSKATLNRIAHSFVSGPTDSSTAGLRRHLKTF